MRKNLILIFIITCTVLLVACSNDNDEPLNPAIVGISDTKVESDLTRALSDIERFSQRENETNYNYELLKRKVERFDLTQGTLGSSQYNQIGVLDTGNNFVVLQGRSKKSDKCYFLKSQNGQKQYGYAKVKSNQSCPDNPSDEGSYQNSIAQGWNEKD